jgi:hypothetical protein
LGLLAVAAVVVVAGIYVVFWPASDLIARHDVGAFTGPHRAAALLAARDAARGRLLTFGAGLFALGAQPSTPPARPTPMDKKAVIGRHMRAGAGALARCGWAGSLRWRAPSSSAHPVNVQAPCSSYPAGTQIHRC